MVVIERQTTYDCAPTLTDEQVLKFTKDGVLTLPAVVPEAINRRCVEFLDALAERNAALGASRGHFGPSDVDPVELLGEEWFVDGVLLCPEVAGAVRSLLGAAFGLPILLHNHRVTPANSPAAEQGWHHVRLAPLPCPFPRCCPPLPPPPPHSHPTYPGSAVHVRWLWQDGGSQFAPGGDFADGGWVELNYLQVFYYPQPVSAEMGPTELCVICAPLLSLGSIVRPTCKTSAGGLALGGRQRWGAADGDPAHRLGRRHRLHHRLPHP
eukprot:COSAG04_NODE_86_length_27446_cov_79.885046_2_plen_267_part_00